MKILIENAVPLNNGDAALIFSLGEQFEKKGYEVFYSTFNYREVIRKYPEKKWVKSPLKRRIITKIPVLSWLYLSICLICNPIYKKMDAIVSAPGGYLNSIYGVKRKLNLLMLYKQLLKKKVYIYSQSIGVLTNSDSKILDKTLKIIDILYVRDQDSLDNINKIGKYDNVYLTKDAAFLFQPMFKSINVNKKRKVAISVREWTKDGDSIDSFKEKIIQIVEILIGRGYDITFLSTCQGTDRYIDDSQIAKEIVNLMRQRKLNTCQVKIDANDYTLDVLREKLMNYEFIVGTRLHMCILGWLSGVPAFNISYEEKGIECYKYLGIEKYSVNYNRNDIDLSERMEDFLDNRNFDETFNKIEDIRQENLSFFNFLWTHIEMEDKY